MHLYFNFLMVFDQKASREYDSYDKPEALVYHGQSERYESRMD